MPNSRNIKYNKDDQRVLARWAADCAWRVLPLFEGTFPEDERPRKAVEVCREWVRTGVFRMAAIREASLGAHAAARAAGENAAACFAARAAGQAVATAHVAQHAYGSAYYALKAIAAADPTHAEARVAEERQWQAQHLREEIMARIVVRETARGVVIRIDKSEGF